MRCAVKGSAPDTSPTPAFSSKLSSAVWGRYTVTVRGCSVPVWMRPSQSMRKTPRLMMSPSPSTLRERTVSTPSCCISSISPSEKPAVSTRASDAGTVSNRSSLTPVSMRMSRSAVTSTARVCDTASSGSRRSATRTDQYTPKPVTSTPNPARHAAMIRSTFTNLFIYALAPFLRKLPNSFLNSRPVQ